MAESPVINRFISTRNGIDREGKMFFAGALKKQLVREPCMVVRHEHAHPVKYRHRILSTFRRMSTKSMDGESGKSAALLDKEPRELRMFACLRRE